MKTLPILLALVVALVGAMPAAAELPPPHPARCLLQVEGRTYIDGICKFWPLDNGDFAIEAMLPEGDNLWPWFAAVGLGGGIWNSQGEMAETVIGGT